MYGLFVAQKVRCKFMPPMGRPKSDNPKTIEVKARVDKKTYEKLMDYCKKNSTTKTEVVRAGIELVLKKEKE